MSWWASVVGGTFGFAMGGPIGALLGAAVGNYFSQGMKRAAGMGGISAQRTQMAFFTALFSMMGHIAKSDGRVSKDEIALTEQVMGQMKLNAQQRKLAKELFAKGKAEDFPYQEVLDQFRRECHRSRNLIQMFLEILMATALADGSLSAKERQHLESIASSLGFNQMMFNALLSRMSAQFRFQGDVSPKDRLEDAYKVLGVSKDTPMADVKKAYRRLMSQHHPDKLVAKGLPEEMMEVATKKTQEIKSAYEVIKEARA
ncbi:MAG: co-chaperone DjlA [Pseudohongiellaceae bacterium]|nr:co-chaperone DjlA [Pseudohongiellaceae bacterium]